MWRNAINYNLFTNQAANWTSTKKILVKDFNHIWVQITTSNTAFTWVIKVKWSRTDNWEDIDFTAANTQDNVWKYLTLFNNNNRANIDWDDWVIIAAKSNLTEELEVNIDWIDYLTVELSWYTAWDVNVDLSLYNNQ